MIFRPFSMMPGRSLRSPRSSISSLDTLIEWRRQLPIIAACAYDVLADTRRPGDRVEDQNENVLRYIVLDLLDVLAGLRVIPRSPLDSYGDATGSFNDQFIHSWTDLCHAPLAHNAPAQRSALAWGRAIYQAQTFDPGVGMLHEGIKIWDTQPDLIVSPSPATWEMAIPRMIAYFYNDTLWHQAHISIYLDEAYQLMENFHDFSHSALVAANMLHRRIRHMGLGHLSRVLTAPDAQIQPHVAGARYAWMQNGLYYALIRGKIERMSASHQRYKNLASLQNLDAALEAHLTLLSTRVHM